MQFCDSVWMSVYDVMCICVCRFVDSVCDVMCICVCRFVVQFGRVLQRQELDAFLAMAVSPLLHDVQTMQDLKVRLLAGLSSLVLNEITGITMCNIHTHTHTHTHTHKPTHAHMHTHTHTCMLVA